MTDNPGSIRQPIGTGYIRGSRVRWVLLLVLPVGYCATASSHPDFSYFAMHGLCLVALALLLTELGKPAKITLPVWIMLFVMLVGYFVKFYWMTWIVAHDAVWLYDDRTERVARDAGDMMRVFGVITGGFIAFSIAAWYSLASTPSRYYASVRAVRLDLSERARTRAQRLCVIVLWVIGPLIVVTGIAQAVTGIGVMGADPVVLQYRMAGLIVHTRIIALPAFLLLVIWLSGAYRLRRILIISLVMLGINGLSQSFLSASRGAFIGMMIPVFLLWLVQGSLTGKRVALLLGAVIATAILHPIVTSLRYLRVGGAEFTYDTVQDARTMAAVAQEPSQHNVIVAGLTEITNRVCGTDTLLYAADWPAPSIPTPQSIDYFLCDPDRTFAKVMTQDVAGFGRNVDNHQIALTLLGAPYVIGGTSAAMVTAALWVFLWVRLRTYYHRLGPRTLLIVDVTLMSLLLNLTSDWELSILLNPYGMVLVPTFVLLEILVARLGGAAHERA